MGSKVISYYPCLLHFLVTSNSTQIRNISKKVAFLTQLLVSVLQLPQLLIMETVTETATAAVELVPIVVVTTAQLKPVVEITQPDIRLRKNVAILLVVETLLLPPLILCVVQVTSYF